MKNRIDLPLLEIPWKGCIAAYGYKDTAKIRFGALSRRFFCFPAKVSHSEPLSGRCGADERVTHPLYEHVSHSHPRENVF